MSVNCIHHVSHTGSEAMSVTVIGQPSMGSKLGSVFKESADLLMYSASLTLLLYQSASCPSTDVSLHHCMLWSELHTWDAMALLACLTAALCSAMQVFSCLPVSPMYTDPHSQGIWYTMMHESVLYN